GPHSTLEKSWLFLANACPLTFHITIYLESWHSNSTYVETKSEITGWNKPTDAPIYLEAWCQHSPRDYYD
ncbi:hypothetical protein, partial [Salmonella enterica]